MGESSKSYTYELYLYKVYYKGDNIGKDWSFEVIIDSNLTLFRKHKLEHGTHEEWPMDDQKKIPVIAKGVISENEKIKLGIIVTATEHDLIGNDIGKNNLDFEFIGKQGTFTADEIVKVNEMGKIAVMHFEFIGKVAKSS